MSSYPGLPAQPKQKVSYFKQLRYELWCCKGPIIGVVSASIATTATSLEFMYLSVNDLWDAIDNEPDSSIHNLFIGVGLALTVISWGVMLMMHVFHYGKYDWRASDHRRRWKANHGDQ